MNTATPDVQGFLRERAPRVIDGWYGAVRESGVAFRSPAELRAALCEIWRQAETFLVRKDGKMSEAEAVGAAFIPLRVQPEAAGSITRVLVSAFQQGVPSELTGVLSERVPVLAGGVVSGLYQAATESLLMQQEQIREAYGRSLKQAQERLKVMQAGIEGSLNAVAIVDLEGWISYVNPAFLDMWGFESDREVVGRHIGDFGDWRGEVERALELIGEQDGWTGELVGVRSDGSRFDVQASFSQVKTEAGQIAQLMVFFVDITDRKRVQEALRQRAVQAAFLNKIGEQILGERTAELVLERAVHLARETFGFHQVAVVLLDGEERALQVAAVARKGGDPTCTGCARPLGDGITGWVAVHGETLLVNDVSVDPHYIDCPRDPNPTGSELAVPIRGRGKVVGVLDVQSPDRSAFNESDRVALETLADQIAVGLENAKLYQVLQEELEQRRRVEEALRRSVQRLEMVHEIDQAILGAKSTREIAESVVLRLHNVVSCQRASIDLFDWESEQVTVLAAVQNVGKVHAATGARFPLIHKDWLTDLWQRGGVVDVCDARELARNSPFARALLKDGLRSFVVAPIGFGDELMGLIALGSDRIEGFSDEDKAIVEELADTVSVAIQQARLFDSVRQQGEQLRRTMGRLAEAEETERRRVVRALHDQVGQNLTALDLNLSLVRAEAAQRGLDSLSSRLDDSVSLVEQTNRRIRRLMIDLRPPVLDDYGLLSTLHWYADRFSTRTGIDVRVRGREETARRISPHVENALFRICQEALNNSAKHARAGMVTISLTREEDAIRLRVCDDGVGFSPESLDAGRESWGLLTMRERAESVGARCFFEPGGSSGTCVVVDIPV